MMTFLDKLAARGEAIIKRRYNDGADNTPDKIEAATYLRNIFHQRVNFEHYYSIEIDKMVADLHI